MTSSFMLMIVAFVIVLYVGYQGIINTDIEAILLTATLGGMSWLIKSEYDKARELERLTYESRKQSYEKLLQPFLNVMTAIKLGEEVDQKKLSKSMIEAGTNLIIYGSDEVCKEFNNFRIVGQGEERDKYKILAAYGKLLLAIRKDSGFPETNITAEQILRNFIIDYDQYKQHFQKYL